MSRSDGCRWWAAVLGALACQPSSDRLLDEVPLPALEVGESRNIELRYVEMQVVDYRQTIDLDRLREMPRFVLEETTLVELPVEPLLEAVLERFVEASPTEFQAMQPAARNLWGALRVDPCSSIDVYEGTPLAGVMACGAAFFEPSCLIADLFGRNPGEPLVSTEVLAAAAVEGLVGTYEPWDEHQRLGRDEDGQLVLRTTLADLTDGFGSLPEHLGPRGEHPGVIQGVTGARVIVDAEFAVEVGLSANVLPFQGIDLDNVSLAKVDAIGSQIDSLFDPSDDDWLVVRGVRPRPVLDLALRLTDAAPHDEPPPWTVQGLARAAGERLAARPEQSCAYWGGEGSCWPSTLGPEEDAYGCDGRDVSGGSSSCGGVVDPACALTASVDSAGVVTLTFTGGKDVQGDCALPPPLAIPELVQTLTDRRLHDGGLLSEMADVMLELEAVPVGLDGPELTTSARDTLARDPTELLGVALALSAATDGEADVYYVRTLDEDAGHWLFFVTGSDVLRDEDGLPGRTYVRPGFFADPQLVQKVSITDEVHGDTAHEKVRLGRDEPPVYAMDDGGRVFSIALVSTPSRARVRLSVTRHS